MRGTAATTAAPASADEAELFDEGPARRRRAERGLAVADGTRSTAAASSSSLSSPPLPLAAAALLLLAALAADAAALVGPPPRPPSAAGRSLRRTRATALGYQTGAGGAGGGRGDDAFAAGSKRAKNKKKGKKKNKKKKGKDDFSFRGNLAPTTREELAREVQSALSDDWREFDDDAEEGDAEDGEVEAAVDGDEPCDVSSVSAGRKVRNNCLELEKRPALVLNADYQPLRTLPLSVWSWRDAVKAVLSGKAVAVDVYPNMYARAPTVDVPVPSVIALREYAPYGKAKPAFTRRNVFLRDGYRCQYCAELFRTSELTLDHVEPRSLGGKLAWDNAVTCCKRCNGRKGCLRPSDLHLVGMELRSHPRRPSVRELAAEAARFVPRRRVHPTWAPFLGLPEAAEVEGQEEHRRKDDAAAEELGRAARRKKERARRG